MSMKIMNDTIGNQTRYLTACISVPQPIATPRALLKQWLGISTKANAFIYIV